MLTTIFAPLIVGAFVLIKHVSCHGEEEIGKMGPVEFLWPEDRVWDADHDNTAPCGSVAGPTKRTRFPLAGGGVELTIANESYSIQLAIAISNDPKTQSQFDPIISPITEVEPGHQCYKVPTLPIDIIDGTNATIQFEYNSVDAGRNQTFYACADITFVSARTFTDSIPCFNVTADEFTAVTTSASTVKATSTGALAASSASAAAAAATSAKSSANFQAAQGLSVVFAAAIAIAMAML